MVAGGASHGDMALLLLISDQGGLDQGVSVRIAVTCPAGRLGQLLRSRKRLAVATIYVRFFQVRAVVPAKVVSLVHTGLETTLIKAQVVVCIASVRSLSIRDAATNLIWISKFVKSLVMGRLEVVVDHASLLLLSEGEIMTFQFCL